MISELYDLDKYYNSEYPKSQIVIGNTFGNCETYYNRCKNRVNGKYRGGASFSISKGGIIYKHFNPKHHTDFIGIGEIDRHIISIVLENEGWLIKNKDSEYIDWIGDIYKLENITESRWRNKRYWVDYTEEQIDSLVKLCKKLCNDFDIPLKVMSHNTKTDVEFFEGITYKSNYSKYFYDINPTFDFVVFKNKVELNS